MKCKNCDFYRELFSDADLSNHIATDHPAIWDEFIQDNFDDD